jgi:hypothetical protein
MVVPGGDASAASCSGAATSCSCSIRLGRAFSQTGTYATSSFFLMTEPDDGPGMNASYCVAEPELHLVSRVPSTAAQDAPLIFASDIVLVRRTPNQ